MVITTTEIQNNFGKYLKLSEYEDVIITKNGRKIARLTPYKPDDGSSLINESTPEYAHAEIKVSYEEFLQITEESEKRYELIDGEIYILSSPSYPHQKAVGIIYNSFVTWFKGKKCEPLVSPFDVTLHKSESNICVVQPDILVICDHENIDGKGRYKGTPTLVVEVLSDSTRSKDFLKKTDLYMRTDVKEYWVVNNKDKEILIYTFKDYGYKEYGVENVKAYRENEKAESVTFKGLTVDLTNVF
jgi:prevent-host-death family protein